MPPKPPTSTPLAAAAIPPGAWVGSFHDFDAMLDATPEARERRLAELRRDDPLRAQALESLLAAHAARERGRGCDWLDALPALAPHPAGLAGPGREPATGGRLGPWRLLGELGRGGMSRVWVARREDIPWSREVALKVPVQVPLFTDADGRDPWQRELHQRFERERDLLSRLEHPHIARLYDAGFADGVPWLALERVDGEDIVAWCERRTLGLRDRVTLFRQATQAVQYAHAALVVHRDLKPANILVTAAGSVRLLDFGIARLMDPADLGAPADATRTLLRPMTPAYASPEQLRQEPLTTATDVYSLGLVLYELLSGTHPFLGRRRTPAEIERDIVEGRIVPASRAAAHVDTARARALRGDLEAVIARAMQPEPGDRYPSVADFDADLARWLAGEPVRARPTPWWRRAAMGVQRHPLASTAAAAATTAVLASAGIALVQADRAREQAARAEATRDFVVGLFESADPRLNGARDVPARNLLESAERRLRERAAGDPALEADLLGALGRLWWQSGAAPRALEAYSRRAALLARMADPATHAMALTDEARAAALLGRWPHVAAVLATAEAAAGPAPSTALAARLFHLRGWLALEFEDNAAAAVASLERAATAARQASDTPLELEVRGRLADALVRTGSADAAWRQDGRIDELLRAHPELPVLDVLVARQARVHALWQAGRFAEGWPAVVALMDEIVRRLGPGTALEHEYRDLWRAWLLLFDRPGEVARWFAEDLSRLTLDVDAEGAHVVGSRVSDAVRARARTGDDVGALQAAAQGLVALHGVAPVERKRVVRALAETHLLAGRAQTALETLQAWRRDVEATPPEAAEPEGVGDAALRLGLEAVALGLLRRDGEAIERWQQAAGQAGQRWPDDHPYRAFIAVNQLVSELRAGSDTLLADPAEVRRLRTTLERAATVFAKGLPPDHAAAQAVEALRAGLDRAVERGAPDALTSVAVVADRRVFFR